jgi:hypothetical protein
MSDVTQIVASIERDPLTHLQRKPIIPEKDEKILLLHNLS